MAEKEEAVVATKSPAETGDRNREVSTEELGRLFLRTDYRSRFVVSSPGDIVSKPEQWFQQPRARQKVANER